MKNKKKVGIVIAIIMVIGIIIFGIIWSRIGNPENLFKQYIADLSDKNYSAMYEMLSNSAKNSISQQDFEKRNKNIYEGIDAQNIEVQIKNVKKKTGGAIMQYTMRNGYRSRKGII